MNQRRGDFEDACADIAVSAQDVKPAAGLRKLIEDRCTFEMQASAPPEVVRQTVFLRANHERRKASEVAPFSRDAVLDAVAAQLSLDRTDIERLLFADLRREQRLRAFEAIDAEMLVGLYETAQCQAVLLRATQITIRVRAEAANAYRYLFNKLKFRRLLYTLQREAEGTYRIEIDGPMSLFRSVTKYGLQLALLLPAIQAMPWWQLTAQVQWDKGRAAYRFELEGENRQLSPSETVLSEDITRFVTGFAKLDSAWSVSPASQVIDLVGVGLCVPDLSFRHVDGREVYLEVMGFWSRQAVWRRVEMVEAGLPERIIFAVSERLRVSEEVLDPKLPGCLYVYKGVMVPKRVLERLES
ncbi:MAG: DUF790 family protein [Myxococcota bacterium]